MLKGLLGGGGGCVILTYVDFFLGSHDVTFWLVLALAVEITLRYTIDFDLLQFK